MDAKVANQFISAALDIFKEVCNVELKKEDVEFFPSGKKVSSGIATIIGFTGDLTGQFIILLEESMALKIASAILMGMPVEEYNELAESGVCEMGNMIAGRASQFLKDIGKTCDLTAPSLIQGKEMEIAFYPTSPIFVVHFNCEWGPVKIILRLEGNKK